jgi:2-polyprenyl-3-methyl-5-hydroxy-6-metoxy-1,4-benzoquinol methylase
VTLDLQKQHPLVKHSDFKSLEAYFLHLIHQRAYDEACKWIEGKRVLDWGCNDGFGMDMMRARAFEIAGLDVAPAAVDAARRRFGPGGPRVELYDGIRSPYADSSFDVITGFQLIEHITGYDDFFGDLLRVLSPDGVALLTTPNGRVRLNPGMPPWNRFHAREFTPIELRQLLKRSFGDVRLFGMTGAAEILSVERRRIEDAKSSQRARLQPEPLPPPSRWRRVAREVSGAARSLLPAIPAAPAFSPSVAKAPPSAEVLARFSVADLTYTSHRVDRTLDLLAVCKKPRKS